MSDSRAAGPAVPPAPLVPTEKENGLPRAGDQARERQPPPDEIDQPGELVERAVQWVGAGQVPRVVDREGRRDRLPRAALSLVGKDPVDQVGLHDPVHAVVVTNGVGAVVAFVDDAQQAGPGEAVVGPERPFDRGGRIPLGLRGPG